MFPQEKWIVGDDRDEVPPVPMPNTEVKLIIAKDTWWVTARENRVLPTLSFLYSSLAQSVEHSAVNRVVVGSSPTRGASKRDVCIHIPRREICEGLFFCVARG